MTRIDKNGNENKSIIFWRDKFPIMALVFVLTILCGIIIVGIIGNYDSFDDGWCDYDSCSQQSHTWNYSGKNCFDQHIEDCAEFLERWRECQKNKKELGIC